MYSKLLAEDDATDAKDAGFQISSTGSSIVETEAAARTADSKTVQGTWTGTSATGTDHIQSIV